MQKRKIFLTVIFLSSLLNAGNMEAVPTSKPIPITKQSSFNPRFYSSIGIMHFKLKDLDSKEQISANAPFIKAGIELNRYFSIEALIANSFSDSRYKGYGKSKDINSHFKQYGIYLKAKYPIKNFSPYITAGAQKTKITHLKKSTQTQNSFAYGAGLEYSINNNFSLEAFYKKDYKGKGFGNKANKDEIKLTSFGINLTYKF